MNKKIIKKIFNILSILLLICFVGLLFRDYLVVYEFGSAPFYLYILERLIEFILPAIVCFVIAKKIN